MRFFDRTEEIAFLRKIREMAKNNAQFTVVTGRRRIGKTSLGGKHTRTNRFSISLLPGKPKAICVRTTGLK